MPARPQTHAPVAHIMQQHGERGERTSGRFATKEGFVPSLNRVQLGSPQNAGERLSFEWVPGRGNAIANVPARVAERRIRKPLVHFLICAIASHDLIVTFGSAFKQGSVSLAQVFRTGNYRLRCQHNEFHT